MVRVSKSFSGRFKRTTLYLFISLYKFVHTLISYPSCFQLERSLLSVFDGADDF